MQISLKVVDDPQMIRFTLAAYRLRGQAFSVFSNLGQRASCVLTIIVQYCLHKIANSDSCYFFIFKYSLFCQFFSLRNVYEFMFVLKKPL